MTTSRTWIGLSLAALALPCNVYAAPSDATVAAQPDAARQGLVVARYEGGEVTVGELEAAMHRPMIGLNGKQGDLPSSREEALANLLQTRWLVQEAQRRGYDKQFRVRYTFLDSAVQFMMSEINRPLQGYKPTEEELRQYFEAHRSDIDAPELRRVTQIVVATEGEARALLPQVRAADASALLDLVKKHSVDAVSREDSGYSRYFDKQGALDDRQGSVSKSLADAAFALPAIGATSEVIPLDGKFAIIRLAALRPAYLPSFEQAKPVVNNQLIEWKRTSAADAVVDQARARLAPTVHYELLNLLPGQ